MADWSEGMKFDTNKVRMELIPPSLLRAVGRILTFGAKKYADRNWEKGIKWSRCYGALLRHLLAWWGGEDRDAETKESHLWHAACCLAFLIEYEDTHRELDDRPGHSRPTAASLPSVGRPSPTPSGMPVPSDGARESGALPGLLRDAQRVVPLANEKRKSPQPTGGRGPNDDDAVSVSSSDAWAV